MAHGRRTTRKLAPLGGALHPCDAAYLRDELEKQGGISAALRPEGELARLLVDVRQLQAARALREAVLEESERASPAGGRPSQGLGSKPLTTGLLVMMTCVVFTSRLGANLVSAVLLSAMTGVVTALLLLARIETS